MWERKCYNNCGVLKMDCVPVAVGKCVRMDHNKQGMQGIQRANELTDALDCGKIRNQQSS